MADGGAICQRFTTASNCIHRHSHFAAAVATRCLPRVGDRLSHVESSGVNHFGKMPAITRQLVRDVFEQPKCGSWHSVWRKFRDLKRLETRALKLKTIRAKNK